MLSGQRSTARLLLLGLGKKKKSTAGRLDPLTGRRGGSKPACQDLHAAVILCIFVKTVDATELRRVPQLELNCNTSREERDWEQPTECVAANHDALSELGSRKRRHLWGRGGEACG